MRIFLQQLAAVAAAAIVTTAGSLEAQTTTDLSGGNADQIWTGPVPNANGGFYLDEGALSLDNRRDLIVGAPGNGSVVGKVYVIFGGPRRTGVVSLTTADTIISGASAGDLFGFSTAAGNIVNNEDTVPQPPRNLAVGAPGWGGNRGAVYIFSGGFSEGATLTTSDAVFRVLGAAGDRLGTALATADLNNDGHREIIIGAPGNGRFYVVNGGPGRAGTTLDLSNPATPANLTVGGPGLGEVLAAGDVTGDGISDLLVGSGQLNVVYMYKGRATGGLPTTPDAGFNGAAVGHFAGSSVRLGDFDSDGIRDVLIGAPGVDGPGNDRFDSGAAYVLWGSPSLASRNLAQADVTFYGAVAGDQTGTSVTSGDINRDTPNDIVLLAPGAAGGAGELKVYYGRSRNTFGTLLGDGRRVVDLSTPGAVDRTIVGDISVGAIKSSQVFEVTGEGARDLIVSVPTADTNAGLVYFTISPRLIPGKRTVNMWVNENGAVSTTDTVINPSTVPITWSVSTNRPWLTAGPGAGSAVRSADGAFNIHGTAAGLAPGTHTGTVTITSTSRHLHMSVPVTVNLMVTATVITIDSPAQSTTVVQPFTMSGWAIERTSTASTGVDAVHVYAYRNPGSGIAPVFLGAATYGHPRGDVAAAYGPQFQNSGYQLAVRGLAPGAYRLVAYAHHEASGTFTQQVSADVTIRNNPTMAFDTPAHNSTVTSAFELTGWAIDRSAAAGPGVDAVHVYVIPFVGSGQPPVFMGVASYGWARPDVGGVFGSQFTNSGFHFTITGAAPGVHDVAVYARSTVSGQFDQVMLNRVTVNANSLMSIDLPSAESRVGRDFRVEGWAIDRAAASGSGVDAVHIHAYKNPGSGTPPVFLGAAAYGHARSDVAAAYGSDRYRNSGYALRVTSLTPGVYDIVIFAHSTATNTFNNWAVVRTTVE